MTFIIITHYYKLLQMSNKSKLTILQFTRGTCSVCESPGSLVCILLQAISAINRSDNGRVFSCRVWVECRIIENTDDRFHCCHCCQVWDCVFANKHDKIDGPLWRFYWNDFLDSTRGLNFCIHYSLENLKIDVVTGSLAGVIVTICILQQWQSDLQRLKSSLEKFMARPSEVGVGLTSWMSGPCSLEPRILKLVM